MRKQDKAKPTPNDLDDDLWLPLEDGQDGIRDDPIEQSLVEAENPIVADSAIAFGQRLRFSLGWRFWLAQQWLVRQVEHERAFRGGFLWVPVLLGAGILLYFQLPREPWALAFPGAAGIFAIAAWRSRASTLCVLLAGLALITLGVSLAQLRVARVDTNLLERHRVVELTGKVTRLEVRSDSRVRYTLRVNALDQPKPWPQKVRLTSRKGGQVFAIGDVITGRARLGPPPGPALPGGYDFRFFAWFDGIGGSGFFLGHPELTGHPGLAWDLASQINAIRHQIGQILRSALPDQSSALATALIVGDRSGISDATNETLRRSGLAHILAISGLHMALVSLTVIALVRLIGAFHMELVSRHAVKKWAGGVGLMFATAYLLLSGANVSTQRAYVMAAIMLVAVMFDRRALTMRNVALAAIVVLCIAPEAILHPGFQMSFAAVAALVSGFEHLSNRAAIRIKQRPATRYGLMLLKLRNYLTGLILVPLIAGLSTGLFAAYHFYRVAPLGLLANLLAMPVVSVAVMPSALAGVVLMPFGLEKVALVPMGLSLEMVVAIAEVVKDLSPLGSTGYVPNFALISGALGLMIATLCRSSLKWISLACFALAATGLVQRPLPDAIVAESGRQVGLLLDSGSLVLVKPDAEKFTTRIWREAYRVVETEPIGDGPSSRHRRCDRFGCVLQKPGLVVAHIHNTARLSLDCLQADVLVVPYNVPWACRYLPEDQRPLVIDAHSLRAHGSHAIYAQTTKTFHNGKTKIQLVTAKPTNMRSWRK